SGNNQETLRLGGVVAHHLFSGLELCFFTFKIYYGSRTVVGFPHESFRVVAFYIQIAIKKNIFYFF
ncbi:MAG: hypothetical protein OIF50_15715, partial [Flavobacteriaceae bacterium]|nr:hypothetical protein [Flavobacteriaceae bacterium]